MKRLYLLMAALFAAGSAAATDLDVKIAYYSKVVTAEGVTREARYEEKMLRRAGHVWSSRVILAHVEEHGNGAPHKHFNHVVLPRHVMLENGKPRVEFIDAHAKEVVLVPPAEYDNVSFDGSWDHAYYLLDSKRLKAMPVTSRVSTVAGARWREREDAKGLFERVLWDDQRQVPLVIESGDKAATFFNRMELTVQPTLTRDLPWQKLKGYSQKEYSDFLD